MEPFSCEDHGDLDLDGIPYLISDSSCYKNSSELSNQPLLVPNIDTYSSPSLIHSINSGGLQDNALSKFICIKQNCYIKLSALKRVFHNWAIHEESYRWHWRRIMGCNENALSSYAVVLSILPGEPAPELLPYCTPENGLIPLTSGLHALQDLDELRKLEQKDYVPLPNPIIPLSISEVDLSLKIQLYPYLNDVESITKSISTTLNTTQDHMGSISSDTTQNGKMSQTIPPITTDANFNFPFKISPENFRSEYGSTQNGSSLIENRSESPGSLSTDSQDDGSGIHSITPATKIPDMNYHSSPNELDDIECQTGVGAVRKPTVNALSNSVATQVIPAENVPAKSLSSQVEVSHENHGENLNSATLEERSKSGAYSSTVPGVSWRSTPVPLWRCRWKDPETGKDLSRCFSIKKYGFDRAKQMAEIFVIRVRQEIAQSSVGSQNVGQARGSNTNELWRVSRTPIEGVRYQVTSKSWIGLYRSGMSVRERQFPVSKFGYAEALSMANRFTLRYNTHPQES